MNARFRPLFTVAIEHSYYAGPCRDISFVTPPSTAAALRGGRALTRVLDGRLHTLFAADALGAPIDSLAGLTLTFGLRLVNPWFGNFTAPVPIDGALVPLYANTSNPAGLDLPSGIALTSGVHTYRPQIAARPLTLHLSDGAGNVVATQALGAGETASSFDLRSLPEGIYRIDEDPGGGGLAHALLYLSPELRNAGVWGILAITIDAAFYAAPPAFAIAFAARQELLKYFVVARNFTPTEFDQLSVSDNSFGEEERTEVIFDKVPPDLFTETDISPDLLGDGTSRILMFRSQLPVARRERGMRRIQLNRNGDVLVEHLPQPGADRAQAHLIVYLSKP